MKTKILALFLALASFGWLPSAHAQFTYTDDGGAVTITGYTGPGGAVTIPDTINTDPVTSIGQSAFLQNATLTSITLGTNVTSIGTGAFEQCLSLTNLTVSAGNPDFSSTNGVLFDLNQNALIQFPSGLGGSYTIPNTVTSLEDGAFAFCINVTNVTIPDSVISIGSGFTLCIRLTSVTVGTNVTNIGDEAFAQCNSLASITLGNSVTNLGFQAFASCTSLTNFIIPNSVTSIGGEAFFFCTNLTSVTIPNSVTSIGGEAFYDCPSLASVTLGSGVTNIGQLAFDRCASLTNFAIIAGNPAFSSTNGVLFNQNQTTLIQYPGGLVGSYTIPNGVMSIGGEAFARCTNLTSVIIPNSVTSIGLQAFFECTSLTSVTLGNSVTSIGSQAFFFCTGLTSVTIPNSVTSIGSEAFFLCRGLTNITFLGNEPGLADLTEFTDDGISPTLYYYYGASGWGATYGGLPTVELSMPPQIGGNLGVLSGNFSFTVTGASNQTIVVDASTNLVNWQPIWTNTLSGTTTNFTDPEWTNYPIRFYRAH